MPSDYGLLSPTHRVSAKNPSASGSSCSDTSQQLPQSGFVRLPHILAPLGPIPVSKSTWWTGVKDGRFPKPVKLGPRITAWCVEDIRALIAASSPQREL